MPQCVQNTFKNDLKMAANGQFRATYRRREPAYVTVRPRDLQVKISNPFTYDKTLWTFFIPYKLLVLKWQIGAKCIQYQPKEDHISICQIVCGIFKSGTCLNESLELSPWSEVNPLYSIENKSSSEMTQLAPTYLRTTRTCSMSFFQGSHRICWSYPWEDWPDACLKKAYI